MSRALNIDELERLKVIAEYMYPVDDSMCVNCRINQQNKRIGFVWKMNKELKYLSEDNLNNMLNELEKAAGIKSAIHPVN